MIEEILAQGQAAHRAGRLIDAESSYRRVLAARPDHTEAMYALGVLMAQSRRIGESVDLLKRASRLAPEDTRIGRNLALVQQAAGHAKEAEAEFQRLCDMEPGQGDHRFGLALLYSAQGRHGESIEQFRTGLALAPGNADAWCNLGLACRAAGEDLEALEALNRAIAVAPAMVKAHGNRGALLMALGRWEEAVDAWSRLLALEPAIADVHGDKGVALAQLGRTGEAADCFRRAEELDGANPAHPYNLGRALQDLGLFPEAAEAYDRATARDPGHASAYLNLGVVLRRLGQVEPALEKYARVIELQPGNGAAHLNRGKLLVDVDRFDEALDDFRRAVELMPDNADALSELVHLRKIQCDWPGLAAEEERCRRMVAEGVSGIAPLVFLSIPTTAEEQRRCGNLWGRMVCQDRAAAIGGVSLPPRDRTAGGERLKVGYLSADFHDHPVAHLSAGIYERHDRSRFETFAYSLGPDDGSDMRRRLEGAFDSFTDLREVRSGDAARRIHADGIDILVDLSGFTKNCRPEILACRPAPVQVNFLGFPATMGVDWLDYIIADAVVAPMSEQEFFAERLVHMPDSFLPFGGLQPVGEPARSRSGYGLPEDAFVYCCINNPFKFRAEMFDIWADILRDVPHGVLWLLERGEAGRDNMSREIAARGIDPDRLVFAQRVDFAEHLARHRLADLFLDCQPFNAIATASDALWSGLPVLTQTGQSFVGRGTASLLNALGLPELVTRSAGEYKARAIQLAREPERMRDVRARLEASHGGAALFRTDVFTANLEKAYVRMVERYRSGLPPEPFAV